MLEILDRFPIDEDEARRRRWRTEVERSLESAPSGWLSAAGPPGSEQLAKDRAWVLLAWVEQAASAVAAQRRGDLVETAAFAMSLLEASPLDRRDVMVVAMLVRRASTLAGLPFDVLVERGCARAGDLGAACRAWLSSVADETPPTHEETGSGPSFAFRRKAVTGIRATPAPTIGDVDRGAARRPPGDQRAMAERGGTWPAWARHPAMGVLGAVCLIGVIVALADRGWLPSAGPFVAAVLAPTLVLLVLSWRHRRVGRLSAEAVDQLRALEAAIARERRLDPGARSTRAADQSLADAAERVAAALQRFAWGDDRRAVAPVEDLAGIARDAWLPDAPLSRDVAHLASTMSRLDARVGAMVAAAERRRR